VHKISCFTEAISLHPDKHPKKETAKPNKLVFMRNE
jgi:hypothetical protein